MVLLVSLLACADDPRRLPPLVQLETTRDPAQSPTPRGDDDDEADCVPAAAVVVNELSPSNQAAALDSDGDAPDWIEVANAGAEPVDLAGWTLSDDGDDPAKWAFPAVTLAPGALQLVFASGEPERTRVVAGWDTRVDQGDRWRYLEVTRAVDAGWIEPGFDDSGWREGPSGFGRDDGDDATVVDEATVYARTTFDVSADELADVVALYLHVDYDDGFVAYLNGVEVARENVGVPGHPPAWDEPASHPHEAVLPTGGRPPLYDLSASVAGLLVAGENTLAVEVHDEADSSDLSLVPFLTLGFATTSPGAPSPLLELPLVELHTNFSLKASGERVRLYDPSGCEADDLEPVALRGDESYGRQPDGTGELGYFLEPTPGAPNTTESRPGFAATPTFDPPPGHFPGGVDVTVLGDPAATVRYALEGFEPLETDPVADGPIATGADGEAVVVRARAWQDGLWPSRIATGTWFLRDPGALADVSVVTDPANLWDDELGIYTYGPSYDPLPPFKGANFLDRDEVRPVHLSEWEPDGTQGFAVDASVAIHGGYSRRWDQKSLLVELGSGYGEDSFDHALYPDLSIDRFDRVLLRNAGNDWLGCFSNGCSGGAQLRDGLASRLAAPTGIDRTSHRPAEVWLNGEYWGVYQLNERPDDSWVHDHYGYEDIDLLDEDAQVIHGDADHWLATMDFLRTADLTDPAQYAQVGTYIDLYALVDYFVVELFLGNEDWPNHNIKYWRPRTPDGRWRWIMYDFDASLGQWGNSPAEDSIARLLAPDAPNPEWSTELFRLLITSPEFTTTFLDRYADWLNTAFLPEVTQAELHGLEAEMAPAMPRHVDRWGTWTDGDTVNELADGRWDQQVAWIDEWLGRRPEYARQQLERWFGIEGTWTLELAADPPGAGTFALTAVEVEGPFSGEYFGGVPVTVTAVPAPGYTFAGWSDPSLPNDPSVTLDRWSDVTLVARFQ